MVMVHKIKVKRTENTEKSSIIVSSALCRGNVTEHLLHMFSAQECKVGD